MQKKKAISLIILVITIIVISILSITLLITLNDSNVIELANEMVYLNNQGMYKEAAQFFVNTINIEINTEKNTSIQNGYNDMTDQLYKFGNPQPNFGWVYVEGKMVTRYQFYWEDFVVSYVDGQTTYENVESSKLINVREFGAIGDGITDDTKAIQSAVSHLNENGGTLYFPLGTYLVSASHSWNSPLGSYDSIININTEKNAYIDFMGSTIKLSSNSYSGYNVIYVQHCNNVEIRNGILIGDRLTHDYETESGTHEFGYGIYFYQSSYAKAINMDIYDMTGDAIITKNGESGGTTIISNCNLHHCRRQGISILDSDVVKVDNTNIFNIGTFDGVKGAAPMSGIDIEPDSGTDCVNLIELNNVNISDNTSFGIINIREDLGPIRIKNSSLQNINIAKATIENTRLHYDMTDSSVLRECDLEKCDIYIKNITMLCLPDASLNECVISGSPNETSSKLWLGDTTITNSTIKNILGLTGAYEASNSVADYGIIHSLDKNSVFGQNSRNNIFDNVTLFITGDFYNEFSTIKNSVVFVDFLAETYLNNITIIDCLTRASTHANTVLNLSNCNIVDSGAFSGCLKHLTDTYFKVNALLMSDFKLGSRINNSTIQITNDANRNSLANVYFSNASKVILDKYNNTNKLVNSYSTYSIDYIVEYNGNSSL